MFGRFGELRPDYEPLFYFILRNVADIPVQVMLRGAYNQA